MQTNEDAVEFAAAGQPPKVAVKPVAATPAAPDDVTTLQSSSLVAPSVATEEPAQEEATAEHAFADNISPPPAPQPAAQPSAHTATIGTADALHSEEHESAQAKELRKRRTAQTLKLRDYFAEPGPQNETSPMELQTKKRAAVAGLIVRDTGKSREEVLRDLPILRQLYATRSLQLPPNATEDEIYAAGKKKIEREKLEDDITLVGVKTYVTDKDLKTALTELQTTHPNDAVLASRLTKGYEFGPSLRRYFATVDKFIDAQEKKYGQKQDIIYQHDPRYVESVDLPSEQVLEQLASLSPDELDAALMVMNMRSSARGHDPRSFFRQMEGNLDRQIERMFNSAGTSLKKGTTWTIGGILDTVGYASEWGSSIPGHSHSAATPLDAALAGRQTQLDREFALYKRVQEIVASNIDPMKPTLDWMNDTLEEGLKAAPGAVLPYVTLGTVGMFLSPAGAFLLTAGVGSLDAYSETKYELMNLPDDAALNAQQAHDVALVSAPIKGAVEGLTTLFQFGRFTRVQRALAGLTKPIHARSLQVLARGGLSVTSKYTSELGEEMAQNYLVDPVVQSVISVLKENMPTADWSFYKSRVVSEFPQLLVTLAPAALVFGGLATHTQVRLSSSMTQNVEALKALNFSQAQAIEISSLATQEQRITRAQELWTQRQGTLVTLEEGQKKLAKQMQKLATDSLAARQELERRGILPRAYHTPQDTWKLSFNDGSILEFDSVEEADAAAGHYITQQLGKEHAATREFLSTLLKNLEMGRELAVQIKPEARTVTQAEMDASPTLQQRVVQKDTLQGIISQLQEGAAADTATTEESIALAQVTGDEQGAQVVAQILGSSLNENYDSAGNKIDTRSREDDVLRTTIKIYNGANALTLVEEKLEGDAKVILERLGGRDWLLTHLRAYEKDSGDTLLRAVADDHELRDNDLIEAWSHLGQSYLLGRSTFGAPLQNGHMAQMLQAMASAGLSSAFNAEAQFWNMVQARSQKLAELHAAGKLDATMVAELESQLGLGAGTQQSLEWNTETGTATNTQGETHITAGGETFNLRSPFEFPGFIQRKYREALERWKNTRHQENPEFERSYINLGKTPPVLRVAGANDLPMVVPPGLFRKVTEDSHAVPIEALEALPQSLADPVAVFQSRREGDSILVLTEYEEPGKGPIVITVRLDQKADHGWVINKVTSVYGRPQGDIMSMFNEVPLYVNLQKRKSLGWAQRAGKQYSGRAFHTQGHGKVSSPEDVVKWTQEQQAQQQKDPKQKQQAKEDNTAQNQASPAPQTDDSTYSLAQAQFTDQSPQSSQDETSTQTSKRIDAPNQTIVEVVDHLHAQVPGLVHEKTRIFENVADFLNSDYAQRRPLSPKALQQLHSAEGFYDSTTGQTIVIAGNVELRPGETPHDALTRVILHERVGHDGLKALLGAKNGQGRQLWEKLKNTIPPAELQAIANQDGYTHLQGDTDALAQEWFARKAESSPHLLQKPGLLRDLWHYFKSVLQNLADKKAGRTAPSAERQLHDLLRLSRQAALRPPAPAGTPYSTASSTTTSTGAPTGLNTTSHTTNGTGDFAFSHPPGGPARPATPPPDPTTSPVAPSTPPLSVSESRALLRDAAAMPEHARQAPGVQADIAQAEHVVASATVQLLHDKPRLTHDEQRQLADARATLARLGSAQGTATGPLLASGADIGNSTTEVPHPDSDLFFSRRKAGQGQAATTATTPPQAQTSTASDTTPVSPEVYKKSLPTKNTPRNTVNDIWEHDNTGPFNYLIQGGGEEFWADGIADKTILEAKFVKKPKRSPFIAGSKAADFIRKQAFMEVDDEFRRMAAIINDPSNPLREVEVIVNDSRANKYFIDMLHKHGLNGRVINR